jgi:TPR repeat protein
MPLIFWDRALPLGINYLWITHKNDWDVPRDFKKALWWYHNAAERCFGYKH